VAEDRTARREPGRSRRRGETLEHAILRAASDELLESGYAALTMDRVARRAGTNKNAIYRRWSNRAALAVAAYRQLAAGDEQVPDKGTLRDDALELLRRATRGWSSRVGQIRRSLLAGVADDPALLALMQERAADAGSATWLTVLGRAVARGEAAPESLHPRVATVAMVLLRNEYVTRGLATVSDDVLVEIVDEVYVPLIRGRDPRSSRTSSP
jgi:AcrR family transcriptional regulator